MAERPTTPPPQAAPSASRAPPSPLTPEQVKRIVGPSLQPTSQSLLTPPPRKSTASKPKPSAPNAKPQRAPSPKMPPNQHQHPSSAPPPTSPPAKSAPTPQSPPPKSPPRVEMRAPEDPQASQRPSGHWMIYSPRATSRNLSNTTSAK